MQRYNKQIILPGFGVEAQQKLRNARVLVIGAGGLGCPALLYLATAGVGSLGIVDGDRVEESNLHRQVLYNESDIGYNKATTATKALQQKNSDIDIIAYATYLTTQNALPIIEQYDVVLDCTDTLNARYIINDACALLKKPWVYAAIYQYEGQVAVFNVQLADAPTCTYRDVFPQMPQSASVANCNEVGVLGVLPGILGCMQATETIKLLCGIGNLTINKLIQYNILSHQVYFLDIIPQTYDAPKTVESFRNRDYGHDIAICENTISWTNAKNIFSENTHSSLWVDVREANELTSIQDIQPMHFPYSQGIYNLQIQNHISYIFVFCSSGKRSQLATTHLKERLANVSIYSIKGGVDALYTSIKKIKDEIES